MLFRTSLSSGILLKVGISVGDKLVTVNGKTQNLRAALKAREVPTIVVASTFVTSDGFDGISERRGIVDLILALSKIRNLAAG